MKNKTILPLVMLAVLMTAILPMPALVLAQEEEDQEEQQSEAFTVQVSVSEDTITRGSKQTVNVETNQAADIIGSITYASSFTRAFSGTTGDDNKLAYEWKIGANSKPGTFAVKVIAISLDDRAAIGQTTFTVTNAQAPPVEEQEEPVIPVGNGTGPVVDNGTITEGGNGTVIVPEEPIDINVTTPAENQTAPAETNVTIPTINETIPIPVPINETAGNETIPVEIPVNSTTNQTVPVPELPTNETIPVANETAPPVENVTEPAANVTEPTEGNVTEPASNETVIITPDNQTIPVENGTIIITEPPAENVTAVENQTEPMANVTDTEPVVNQTETLPEEVPINSTTGNVTEPIPIPINSTTGNETIPVPPIDVTIPDNATLPAENVTAVEPEPEPEPNATDVSAIIAELDERTTVLENASASEQDLFEAVGVAIEQMGNAISIVPGLTDEEQAAVIDSVNEVMQAIKNLR